jgi:hypothetical protein
MIQHCTRSEDINVPRNGHSFLSWEYLDDAGNPYDLTGSTATAVARNVAGGPDILATCTVVIASPTAGIITTRWNGADFDGYGEPMAVSIASYDIKIQRADGIIDVPVHGHLFIIPECTV